MDMESPHSGTSGRSDQRSPFAGRRPVRRYLPISIYRIAQDTSPVKVYKIKIYRPHIVAACCAVYLIIYTVAAICPSKHKRGRSIHPGPPSNDKQTRRPRRTPPPSTRTPPLVGEALERFSPSSVRRDTKPPRQRLCRYHPSGGGESRERLPRARNHRKFSILNGHSAALFVSNFNTSDEGFRCQLSFV
jgi:hypothetical protein